MSISLSGITGYQTTNALASTPSGSTASLDTAGSTDTNQTQGNTIGTAGNNSSLSTAINQALMQMNSGMDLSTLLTPESQQSNSDFMNSLFASLDSTSASGLSSENSLSGLFGDSSEQATAPVALNQSSPTIQLQTAIQNIITQLNGNSNTDALLGAGSESDNSSWMGNLQQSFNNLVTSSGGDPSQTSLQSFLKTIATNIQGSMSVGTLFDAIA